ncbi:glycine cleavage system protein GcvH [Polynucleobacter paneuropaeus]|uniref:glycine cleavage system protein GcvH n=1 Tax=Polynucleobacter paludilacus TaxID=1855895 RepID=UPI001BFD0FAB|nr:glycine cleavage system protein GcvH [Polynucleobacter paludilacus]MBT8530616.1 glycine cleavage system protein GcvH [Polynucleobacter paneuropaeus]QWD87042.1 glycine cleavage system protein GcvH [Polynucleobacter paludilacus]
MMNTQEKFRFAQTHEWADPEDDGLVWVGISNHAQEALGDVMFFQAPKLGLAVRQGETIAVIESVKAASDIHAPISGEIVALNPEIESRPEIINEKPYSVWLFKIKPNSAAELNTELHKLMDLENYSATAGA